MKMFVISIDSTENVPYFEEDEDGHLVDGGYLPQGLYQVTSTSEIVGNAEEPSETLLGVTLDEREVFVILDLE